MAINMRSFWEGMSGTSKQEYGASLYDAKDMKKWQKEQAKWYKNLGTTRDRYGTQSTKFMGKYEEAEGEADRYRGLAEGSFGDARRSIGRADTSFGRSQADISRARQSQMSANALMADRDHYANLKDRADARRRGIQGDRLGMQALRGRLGKPARDTGMTQRLMDAFKGSNESSREMMEANTAQLAKVNPVAAARMQAQFNEGTLRSLGQLKQQGMVTDQQLSDNNLTREAGMLMDSTSLYGQEAAQDQMMAGIQQQQIQNFGAAGTQALNTAGAEGAIARGRLAQAGQYGQIGAQYGGLGSQLDARAGRALGAGMDYEGMGYQALQDQTSIANRRVERQDKFRMSDASARARVDSFNRSRAQMGISNALKVVETGARIYGAVQTAGATEAAIAAMNARNKPTPGVQGNDTSTSLGQDSFDSSQVRNASYSSRYRGPTGQSYNMQGPENTWQGKSYDDYNYNPAVQPVTLSPGYSGGGIYNRGYRKNPRPYYG